MAKRKGILRWAGSKRGVLSSLLDLAPTNHSQYVEPFAGSAVMYFALDAQKAFLSDLNKPLVNFYTWLRYEPEGLFEQVCSWDRTKEVYLLNRSVFDTSGEELIDAALFFYLNSNCFNGIYRTNRSNRFNVPFAGERMANMPSFDEFSHFSKKLENAEFECCDFRSAIRKNLAAEKFFYIDPPYFVDDRRVFREYGPEYFSQGDLNDLSDLLDEIDDSGARFMVSYADCELARKIFKKWPAHELLLTRNVGGFKKSRRQDAELVLRNYD